MSRSFGLQKGRFADFIRSHGPFVLLAIPCVLSELIGYLAQEMGHQMIGVYLLQRPELSLQMKHSFFFIMPVIGCAYWAANVYFLFPLFRANSRQRKNLEISSVLLLRARTRLYNFPLFLIGATYFVWIAGIAVVYFSMSNIFPHGALLATGMLSTVLNAIIVYYITDLVNRFYLFPHWFPDGNIRVSFRIRKPSLFNRFLDMFLITGIFPVVAIVGIVMLTRSYGVHDPDELQRIVFTGGIIGIMFWFFGLLLAILNAGAFLIPINAMEKKAEEMSRDIYDTAVAVHSDDQIGNLEKSLNEMGRELREKQVIKTLFGHYVSPGIRDLILEGRIKTDGNRIEAVVLFTDIRSFTALTEKHQPETVVKFLNIHFSRVVEVVSRNYGFVDKFIGDSVMAVFDAEFCGYMHRLCAMTAAAEILRSLEKTNSEIADMGISPIKVGVGIACGTVIRGNVGSENRRELTVIGDIVNVASRLESATRETGFHMLATKDSYDRACSEIPGMKVESSMPLSVKGKTEPVDVLLFSVNG